MCMHPLVGEEEVMRMNEEAARERTYTAADAAHMPEDIRAEVIDGQLFYFAAPTIRHQDLLGELYLQIRLYIREKGGSCKVFPAPTALRFINDDKTYLEPDLIVVCDKEKLGEDACYGAPDLVVEIASPSTRKRDYGLKLHKYREAGVREYWILDPQKGTVMVYWFEDETENCLYSLQEPVSSHALPGLVVQLEGQA